MAIALLVATAYYVGSRVGLVLKFQPLTPSHILDLIEGASTK